MKYIVYDSTGKIIQHGECPPQFFDMQAQGQSIMEGECNDALHYVDVATKTIKDKLPIGGVLNKPTVTANGLDSCIISGLPNPTTALCENKLYTVTDTTFEATFTLPGTYKIILNAQNRLQQEFTVTAI